jgi:hypothetical protein
MASKRVSSDSGIMTAWRPSFSRVRGPFSQSADHHRITNSVDRGASSSSTSPPRPAATRGWLAYDPYHDWLPDVDLADLADQPALPANGA